MKPNAAASYLRTRIGKCVRTTTYETREECDTGEMLQVKVTVCTVTRFGYRLECGHGQWKAYVDTKTKRTRCYTCADTENGQEESKNTWVDVPEWPEASNG